MVINNNLQAMNAQRNLGINAGGQSKSMEKLSSGLRINRAGDDAAGLAISEKMRNQVKGLQKASANAQDGISLIQTAEGALGETHEMLKRMRELAIQSSNGTLTEEDRSQLDAETQQLLDEIDGIADKTEFNEQILLKGGTTKDALAITGAKTKLLQAGSNLMAKEMDTKVKAASSSAKTASAASFNKSIADIQAEIDALEITAASQTGSTLAITLNSIKEKAGNLNIKKTSQATLEASAAVLKASADTLLESTVTIEKTSVKTMAASLQEQLLTQKNTNKFEFQVGANQAQKIQVNIMEIGADSLGLGAMRVTNQGAASIAIGTLDTAINMVSSQRADLGAVQNRLEHTIKNVDNTAENLQSAESAIRDTDMAAQMVELTKYNILTQASQSMLSQANQAPQQVLQLLG